MSRRTVIAGLALALALVVVSAAPAKKPPPPPTGGGGGPTNLRITASSDYSISLAWDAANGGSTSWWYCVVRDGLGCLRVDPPQTTLSLSRLWPGRTTTYTVVTVNSNGHRSAPSNSVTHTTPARDYFGNTVESNVLSVTTPPKTDNNAPTAPTNLQFSSETAPPELWLTWNQSSDDTDSASLILYETYLNGVLVPDGGVGGTNTIAYCRDNGPTTVVLKAVDASGNRSGPSNELNITC